MRHSRQCRPASPPFLCPSTISRRLPHTPSPHGHESHADGLYGWWSFFYNTKNNVILPLHLHPFLLPLLLRRRAQQTCFSQPSSSRPSAASPSPTAPAPRLRPVHPPTPCQPVPPWSSSHSARRSKSSPSLASSSSELFWQARLPEDIVSCRSRGSSSMSNYL